MTTEQALAEVSKITPRGRFPLARIKAGMFWVGFHDTEFNYWFGSSGMGYAFAIQQMKKRLEKR